jgi:hypothetical protein
MLECLCPRKMGMDVRKEYARVVFFTTFSETNWSVAEKQDFLVQACKFRLPLVLSTELCMLLVPGKEPRRNPDVRPYTLQERNDCYHTHVIAVHHVGCAQSNCEQSFSADCENVMCGTHCRRGGSNPCHVAKHNSMIGVARTALRCSCCVPPVYGKERETLTPRRGRGRLERGDGNLGRKYPGDRHVWRDGWKDRIGGCAPDRT